MRARLLYLTPLVVVCLSCGGSSRDSENRLLIEDDLGRTVHFETPIRRLITLSPSVTEVVYAAGAGDLLVAVTVSDDYPPEVASLPRFNTYPVDFEAIVGLGPDLILASDQVSHPAQVATLDRLGIPTYFLSSRELHDLPNVIRRVGRLLGTSHAAERAADSLAGEMKSIQAITGDVDERPDVLVLASANPLYAFGSESYVHDLVALAGGNSVTESLQTSTPILSDEFVLRAKPDVIVGTDSSVFTPLGILTLHPTWDIVPAVVEGRVYAIDPDLLYRPGPRLVEGARTLAGLLHPRRMAEASR